MQRRLLLIKGEPRTSGKDLGRFSDLRVVDLGRELEIVIGGLRKN